jgi:superfamily II DNA/RNA helicase
MEHRKQGNVFFNQVSHVIIDEVDTMLTQGFGSDIRAILRSTVARNITHEVPSVPTQAVPAANALFTPVVPGAPRSAAAQEEALRRQAKEPKKPAQLVMATATLTKAVRALLNDVQGGFNVEFSGKFLAKRTLQLFCSAVDWGLRTGDIPACLRQLVQVKIIVSFLTAVDVCV